MAFDNITMKVDGQPVSIDFEEELEVGDISEDMSKVAAQLAYWGAVWAAAESEAQRADAAYRQWRGDQSNMILDSDSKLAEWKVRAKIEEMDTFVSLKAAIAQAASNVVTAKSIFEAFKVKAHVLQSKGAMLRAEMDPTGTRTMERPSAKPKRSATPDERGERESAMRAINRKKSKKS